MVHTGVAKPVCSCARMLSLLLPISGHSMLPVLKMFLLFKKSNNNKKYTPQNNPEMWEQITSCHSNFTSVAPMIVKTNPCPEELVAVAGWRREEQNESRQGPALQRVRQCCKMDLKLFGSTGLPYKPVLQIQSNVF